MDKPSATRRRSIDPLAGFRAYLDEIEQAVLRRDAMRITALLRKRTATHLPREVREELLFLARAPGGSLRAPVHFLRFQHRMTQLALGGEHLPTAQTELRLEPRQSERGGVVRVHEGSDRKSAACEPADDSRDEGSPPHQ
jgi:hypothetical protein